MPPILDAAIGTVFVFLLFSLVVSAMNEYILSLFDQRAKFLRMGLAELFGASVAKTGFVEWLKMAVLWPFKSLITGGGLIAWRQIDVGKQGDRLLDHGLINAFSRSDGGTSPSYIPAGAFVTALLDIVAGEGAAVTQGNMQLGKANAFLAALRKALPPAGVKLPFEAFELLIDNFITDYGTLAEILSPGSPLAQLKDKATDARLRATVQKQLLGADVIGFPIAQSIIDLPENSSLKAELDALVAKAGGNFEAFQPYIEAWFSLDDSRSALEASTAGTVAQLLQIIAAQSAAAIEGGINQLPQGKLRESLLSLFRTVEGDVQKFKTAVEGWFNGVMDRVSGWYKRFAQKWMIAIGFVLAATFNVDTIEVVRVLSNNPNLARAVADQATTYASAVEKPLDDAELERQRETKLQRVADVAAELKGLKDAKAPPEQIKVTQDEFDKATADANALTHFKSAVAKLGETGLPIGWTSQKFKDAGGMEPDFSGHLGWDIWSVICWPFVTLWTLRLSLPGWFLTAIAASLGAPFWFDLLGRFINVRAAGKAPGERETTSTPTRPLPANIDTTPGTRIPNG